VLGLARPSSKGQLPLDFCYFLARWPRCVTSRAVWCGGSRCDRSGRESQLRLAVIMRVKKETIRQRAPRSDGQIFHSRGILLDTRHTRKSSCRVSDAALTESVRGARLSGTRYTMGL